MFWLFGRADAERLQKTANAEALFHPCPPC
jgi:hypothetical protein